MRIGQEQIQEFYTEGFTVIDSVFTQEEIAHAKGCFERLWKVAQGLNSQDTNINESEFVFEKGGLNRIVWCGGVEQDLLNLSVDQRILIPVSQLLNTSTFDQLLNQAHFKMPGEYIEFKWHQDSEHRRYGTHMWNDVDKRGSYVQTLLAIDEMTLENGPVVIIPKSNQLGHLDLKNDSSYLDNVQQYHKVKLTLKPGDMALFGPYTVHSSSANLSNSPRRVLINGYSYPGANGRVYPGAGLGKTIDLNNYK